MRDFAAGLLISKQLITGRESRRKRRSIDVVFRSSLLLVAFPLAASRQFQFLPALAWYHLAPPPLDPLSRISLHASPFSSSFRPFPAFFCPHVILSFYTRPSSRFTPAVRSLLLPFFLSFALSLCVSFASSPLLLLLCLSYLLFPLLVRLLFFLLARFFSYLPVFPRSFYTYTSSPFPSISSFSLGANVVSLLPTLRTLSHSERAPNGGKERRVPVIICTHPGCAGASTSPVRKTWKLVRHTQPRRTSRRQTARHGCSPHLHVATPRHRQWLRR